MKEKYDKELKVSTVTIDKSDKSWDTAYLFVNSLVNFNVLDVIVVEGIYFGIRKKKWNLEDAIKWIKTLDLKKDEVKIRNIAEEAITGRCSEKFCKIKEEDE